MQKSLFDDSGEVSDKFKAAVRKAVSLLKGLAVEDLVASLNYAKQELHIASPFKDEPVDCVLWVPCDSVSANDYNPNSVAPPEMELLAHSILSDGYTQPIVGWSQPDESVVVVDGFHRHKVGKENNEVRARVSGYLPVVKIKSDREDRNDRMAATIRHNRARGKHKVESMSDIVVELRRRKWSDARIAKELGMEMDEVLRLAQVSGLADIFKDREFSQAWEAEGFDE